MFTNTAPTLFNMTPRCFNCGDLGIEIDSAGNASTCWRLRAGAVHNAPNAAALLIQKAIEKLQIAQVAIDPHVFDVAKTLLQYTSAMPCKRDRLIDAHFAYSPSALRNFHGCIETLRKVWLLPVGSRKEAAAGYWIITDMADFADWVERAKSAPITQLTTIHRVAKRNFPIFAEQMEIDFWQDTEPQPLHAAAA